MNKKKRRISVIEIIGISMVLLGLGIIAWDFATDYFARQSINREMQDFLNAPNVVDPQAMPDESSAGNMWGTIEIPKLNLHHPIIVSSDWGFLNRYVVAWPNSSIPPEEGNFSIAGHNGRCASCVFRNFEYLKSGDEIRLTNKDQTVFVYSIYDVFEVHYTDTSVLLSTPNETTLTLVTCSEPNEYAEYRTIVKAKLVETITK